MDDISARLHKLLVAHPEKNLSEIHKASGVPYFRLRAFLRKEGHPLRLDNADKLHRFLTGKPLGTSVLKVSGKGAA